MSIDEQTPQETATKPAGTARALVHWWREGARSAVFLTPRWTNLEATPALVACLILAQILLIIAGERLYVVGPAEFQWPVLMAGWSSVVASIWACWWVTAPHVKDNALDTPGPAAVFAMLNAQGLILCAVALAVLVPSFRWQMVDGGETVILALRLSGLALLAWMAAAQAMVLWRITNATRLTRIGACLLIVASVVVHAEVWPRELHWRPVDVPDAEEKLPEPLTLSQELFERQHAAAQSKLDLLGVQRPGVIDVYTITFAPYATEDVFRRESQLVAGVMGERFGAAGRSVQLVNHRDTVAEWPWATPLNLKRAIERIASTMDRDEDVLFIHLTSHGAADGKLSAWFWPLAVDELTPAMLRQWLDEAGVRHRIVSVSACFSGSWIPPLSDAGTLVMTAADAEHTSYGCGRKSELTFFGRALYDEALRRTWSFEKAHAAARTVIEQREKEAGKTDGFSNPQIVVGERMRDLLSRLESQQAASH